MQLNDADNAPAPLDPAANEPAEPRFGDVSALGTRKIVHVEMYAFYASVSNATLLSFAAVLLSWPGKRRLCPDGVPLCSRGGTE